MSPVALGVVASGYRTASWSPASLPGLSAWYDLSDAASVTTSSGNITALADKSGNGLTLTNTGTVPYASAVQKGRNAAQFGSGTRLTRALGSAVGVGGITIMSAYRRTGTATYNAGPIMLGSSSSGRPIDGYSTTRIALTTVNSTGWTNLSTLAGWNVLTWTAVASGANTVMSEYLNGTLVNAFTFAGATYTTTSQTIVMASRADGVTQMLGYVGESIICTGVLSSTDRAAAESYLAGRWI